MGVRAARGRAAAAGKAGERATLSGRGVSYGFLRGWCIQLAVQCGQRHIAASRSKRATRSSTASWGRLQQGHTGVGTGGLVGLVKDWEVGMCALSA